MTCAVESDAPARRLGDALGLCWAMADGQPVTADEVAARAGTDPRATLDWLRSQATAGHVVEQFARQRDEAALLDRWLPALGRPVDRLSYGGKIAHVGCGRGATTIRVAMRYPLASVHGFDPDGPSIDAARVAARSAGVEARCTFSEVAPHEVPAGGYDLLLLLDCLHDVADPLGAARRVRKVMAPDGVALVVDPTAVSALLLEAGFAEVTPVVVSPFHQVLAAHPRG